MPILHLFRSKPYLLFLIYFGLIIALAPFNILSIVTYYYWDWSRHLALSYYDGPPLIAYLIRSATLIFGDTQFALAIVGVGMTALTCQIIYRSTRLFLSKQASYVALGLWLFSPLVTLALLKQTTYDAPLTLFWALVIYNVLNYIKASANKYLYYIGLNVGLLLLSKYSGIVLVLALLVIVFATSLRRLLYNYHFYLAIGLALTIFSPVVVWNYQHAWQSFGYQLTTHHEQGHYIALINISKMYIKVILPALNFMLIPTLWYGLKRNQHRNLYLDVCYIISLVFIMFYSFAAYNTHIRALWLTQYLVTAAMLGGYFFEHMRYKRETIMLVIAYAVVSLAMIVNVFFHFSESKNIAYFRIIQTLNQQYPTLPKVALTSGWFEARMLFFLKNKPLIYTADCGARQNQYALWSNNLQYKINQAKHVLYIDTFDRIACVQKYFDHCTKLNTMSYPGKRRNFQVFAYNCLARENVSIHHILNALGEKSDLSAG